MKHLIIHYYQPDGEFLTCPSDSTQVDEMVAFLEAQDCVVVEIEEAPWLDSTWDPIFDEEEEDIPF